MTVTIRRIGDSDREYFAYTKSLCGRATYFVYFTDDIWGAMTLHDFVEMLRKHFEVHEVDLAFRDTSIQLKNELLLEVLRDPD